MAPRVESKSRKAEPVAALGLVAPPPIYVQSPRFEGSLAVLFECVRDSKVRLDEVPLLPICEAYFEYVLSWATPNLDEAAAALAALAYLLERKAWGLLPISEPEPALEETLELPAASVGSYEPAVDALEVWREERSRRFFRTGELGVDVYELPVELDNVRLADLAATFERVMRKARPDPIEQLGAPRQSVETVMRGLLLLLGEAAPLESFLPAGFTRSDAVFTFLALLELIRLGQAHVELHDDGDARFARVR